MVPTPLAGVRLRPLGQLSGYAEKRSGTGGYKTVRTCPRAGRPSYGRRVRKVKATSLRRAAVCAVDEMGGSRSSRAQEVERGQSWALPLASLPPALAICLGRLPRPTAPQRTAFAICLGCQLGPSTRRICLRRLPRTSATTRYRGALPWQRRRDSVPIATQAGHVPGPSPVPRGLEDRGCTEHSSLGRHEFR